MAPGIDSDGQKHPLGIQEGNTENAAVAKALLADLVERGLPTDRALAFVIDGSKALREAIEKTLGSLALIRQAKPNGTATVPARHICAIISRPGSRVTLL